MQLELEIQPTATVRVWPIRGGQVMEFNHQTKRPGYSFDLPEGFNVEIYEHVPTRHRQRFEVKGRFRLFRRGLPSQYHKLFLISEND